MCFPSAVLYTCLLRIWFDKNRHLSHPSQNMLHLCFTRVSHPLQVFNAIYYKRILTELQFIKFRRFIADEMKYRLIYYLEVN